MSAAGEIRQAIARAAATFGADGATWRQLAVAAQVGFDIARMTVENMVRAGQLVVVGTAPRDGGGRPLNRCALPTALSLAAEREQQAVAA